MRRRPPRRLRGASARARQGDRRRPRPLGGSVRRQRRAHSALRKSRSGSSTERKPSMNEIRQDLDTPRILGRVLAQETTMQELEESHGGAAGGPTFTLTYPPDKDHR